MALAREVGFTLLELLIAFIIAAIALGVLFGGAAEGLRSSRAALQYEEAIARARSHLAASRVNPAPSDREGDDGSGFHWRILIRPVGSFHRQADASPTSGQPSGRPEGWARRRRGGGPWMGVTLYSITIWITWREAGQAREVRLDSESLMPEPSVGPSARPMPGQVAPPTRG